MTEWHKYAVGSLPKDYIVDGGPVPIPVIVRFDSGREEEDWIVGGELFLYCEKSCAFLFGRPIEWRYQYDKTEFLRRVNEYRELRAKRRPGQ